MTVRSAVLAPDYLSRSAELLAPELLGKWLCRRLPNGQTVRCRITETEVYCGEEDTACHASHGRTKRSEVLYHQGGAAYVYRCHMYWLLTLVTGAAEHPEGVLVRGTEDAPGPGLVGGLLEIVPALHGLPLTPANGLWLEDDGFRPPYAVGTRIGIGRAAPADRARLWRFTVTGLPER